MKNESVLMSECVLCVFRDALPGAQVLVCEGLSDWDSPRVGVGCGLKGPCQPVPRWHSKSAGGASGAHS